MGAASFGLEPGLANRAGELAHAQDEGLPFGHRDHVAGVEQIENV
jgi:hypothetical protein